MLLCLGEEVVVKTLRNGSIEYAKSLTLSAVKTLPAKVLLEINKRVGKELITQSGKAKIVNLVAVVPYVGGVVGGSVDGMATYAVGHYAKNSLRG